jgi:hypothetical protein
VSSDLGRVPGRLTRDLSDLSLKVTGTDFVLFSGEADKLLELRGGKHILRGVSSLAPDHTLISRLRRSNHGKSQKKFISP